MKVALNTVEESITAPEGATVHKRKVARSGHIFYKGRPYFVSKVLAGHSICLVVLKDRLIIDATISLHKEYPLVEQSM